jgi:hypothetical protein
MAPDYVADLICDGGGTMQLLKCIRYHKDDVTALKNMMQLLVMLARTEKNVKLLNKAKAIDTLKSIQVGCAACVALTRLITVSGFELGVVGGTHRGADPVTTGTCKQH